MQYLGINSYPYRWKRIILFVSLLSVLLTIEGLIVLVYLLLEPSESSSKFLFGYSLGHWALVFSTMVFIGLSLLIFLGIKARTEKVESILEKLTQHQIKNKLPGFITGSVIFFGSLLLWLSKNDVTQPYYFRLFPLLLLFFITMIQIWLLVIVGMRKTAIQGIKAFFTVSQNNQFYPISNRNLFFALTGLSLIYLFLQVDAYLDVRQAIPLGDTTSFFEGASLKLSNPAFFSERRPWGILLAYKILNNSFSAIEIAQLTLSTFSWLSFAWTFSRSLKTLFGKLTGFSFILGFSLSPTVQVWNHVAMSESFTISFTILLFATLVLLLQEWKWYLFVILALLFLYWMSIHEVNLYIGLMASIVFLVIGIIQKKYRIFWLLSFFIGIIFLINYQLSSLYGLPRWSLPVAEVITKRILPNQEYLDFFIQQGMPVSPELMSLNGRWAHSDNYAIINSVKLRSFSKWLFNHGNTVYAKFLLTHPLYLAEAPLKDIQNLLATDFSEQFLIQNYVPALPAWGNELLYPIRIFKLYLWFCLMVVGSVFVKKYHFNTRTYWSVFFFFLLSIPYLYLAWHGDALGVERHTVIANIQFHLSIGLLFSIIIDQFFSKERNYIKAYEL